MGLSSGSGDCCRFKRACFEGTEENEDGDEVLGEYKGGVGGLDGCGDGGCENGVVGLSGQAYRRSGGCSLGVLKRPYFSSST